MANSRLRALSDRWRSYAHREISALLPVLANGIMPTLILFVGVGVYLHDKALRIMFAPYSASALASGVTPNACRALSTLHG